jgi:hypothetical protein
MISVIYILAAATCLLCAVLLLRGYKNQRNRLLLWSGICFIGLMLENVMMYVDLVTVPELDLSLVRRVIGLVALSLLLFGLIWESK